MPPKKATKKDGGEGVEGDDPAVFLQNYIKYARLIGLPVHQGVVKCLMDEEHYPIEQLVIDEEHGPLGPGGTRALTTAIMGSGPGMKTGPYRPLKSLRFWKSNVEDEGANSIVSLSSWYLLNR